MHNADAQDGVYKETEAQEAGQRQLHNVGYLSEGSWGCSFPFILALHRQDNTRVIVRYGGLVTHSHWKMNIDVEKYE